MPGSPSSSDPAILRAALARGRMEHGRAVRRTFAALARALTAPFRRPARVAVVPRGVTRCGTC